MITKINSEIYVNYYEDLYALINYFTNYEERTQNVMKNLKTFIEDGTAIAAGHQINERLASFIWCYRKKFGGSERLHVSYFIVGEQFRGQGLSKDLISYTRKVANELGISEIDLNVEPENEKAIKLYHNSGFITEKLQLLMKLD